VRHFEEGSRFVEVGTYLGRSLCSLAEVVRDSGKRFSVIGVDTCRGSGVEGPKQKDSHASAVAKGGGTFAGTLHRNIIECGFAETVTVIVSDSVTAASLFADQSIDWVHLDASHDRTHLSADIAAWLPKVRSGGWLSGDDYNREKWPEVVNTVKELLPGAQKWSSKQWRLMVEGS
jgi:cephalosporin hydroxylase